MMGARLQVMRELQWEAEEGAGEATVQGLVCSSSRMGTVRG
jgi:hypothetical protein